MWLITAFTSEFLKVLSELVLNDGSEELETVIYLFTYPLNFNLDLIINLEPIQAFLVLAFLNPYAIHSSPPVFSPAWHISFLLFLSQLCRYDMMFYETRLMPLSLVLFSNLNLILLVLNEKY